MLALQDCALMEKYTVNAITKNTPRPLTKQSKKLSTQRELLQKKTRKKQKVKNKITFKIILGKTKKKMLKLKNKLEFN